MKFLLDVNVAPRLGDMLHKEGHSYRHIALIGLGDSTDTAILELARRNNEVVITHDLDFGALLAFSNASSPSVITLRLHQINTEAMFKILSVNWHNIEKPLIDGALVLIEQEHIRIRHLPIERRR
ncbi:MAG: DUF5615 family PIN-like protein [Candidatus Kapabacteria bacterium]|jgi:predicted nuclease of predicted toxin-antitoxin system|nr:DUF5615 family PIN-like protein [Candidatus Kapabacteria bacterium]